MNKVVAAVIGKQQGVREVGPPGGTLGAEERFTCLTHYVGLHLVDGTLQFLGYQAQDNFLLSLEIVEGLL